MPGPLKSRAGKSNGLKQYDHPPGFGHTRLEPESHRHQEHPLPSDRDSPMSSELVLNQA